VPFPVLYFGCIPVDDMIAPATWSVIADLFTSVRKAFLSALVWTLLLTISMPFLMFFESFTKTPACFSNENTHSYDMIACTHIHQCLLFYVCALSSALQTSSRMVYQKLFANPQKPKWSFFPFALKFSCICLTVKMASVVPLPFINPNCVLSMSICC